MGKSYCAQSVTPVLAPPNRNPKPDTDTLPLCRSIPTVSEAGSSITRECFARHGLVCLDNVNPAEHVSDAISLVGLAPQVGDCD